MTFLEQNLNRQKQAAEDADPHHRKLGGDNSVSREMEELDATIEDRFALLRAARK